MSDIIDAVKDLERAGFSRMQSEAQLKAMDKFIKDKFATKQEMASEFKLVRQEMQALGNEIVVKISDKLALYLGVAVAVIAVLLTIFGIVISLKFR